MVVNDAEIDRLVRDTIARHGQQAVRVAAEKLNEMIDRDNVRAAEVWACVVHLIHQRQGTGPVWAGQMRDWRNEAPRLATF